MNVIASDAIVESQFFQLVRHFSKHEGIFCALHGCHCIKIFLDSSSVLSAREGCVVLCCVGFVSINKYEIEVKPDIEKAFMPFFEKLHR